MTRRVDRRKYGPIFKVISVTGRRPVPVLTKADRFPLGIRAKKARGSCGVFGSVLYVTP